jgi:hypothetical protein
MQSFTFRKYRRSSFAGVSVSVAAGIRSLRAPERMRFHSWKDVMARIKIGWYRSTHSAEGTCHPVRPRSTRRAALEPRSLPRAKEVA